MPSLNRIALLLIASAAAASVCSAGEDISFAGEDVKMTKTTTLEPTPVDVFDASGAYVFQSDLNHGGSFGEQYEAESGAEYGHRFLINDHWYFRLGLAYHRFDFGNTDAPVPVHLQSGVAVIGVEYMKGPDAGAFLYFRPGFYTENKIGLNSFDCQIIAGRFWELQQDKLYFLTGVSVAFLRGGWPVLPFAGLVWEPNEHWKILGVPPDPQIIYIINKQWEVYLQGELAGDSFRTDHHDDYVGRHIAKLSGTQVDYKDYRLGCGATWHLSHAISVDGTAGCSVQRSFNYHRAGEYYRTDPAPYLEVALHAAF